MREEGTERVSGRRLKTRGPTGYRMYFVPKFMQMPRRCGATRQSAVHTLGSVREVEGWRDNIL